ncbi:hypothetical protein ACB092_01G039100, partial [Castanea dentata]
FIEKSPVSPNRLHTIPKVNKISFERNGGNRVRGRGRGKNIQNRGRRAHNPSKRQNTPYNKRLNQTKIKQHENGRDLRYKSQKGHEKKCYRCGIKGHWSHTCHMPKHLVDLYQASLKEKGKGVEVNLAELELGGEKSLLEARREITWNALTLSHHDPHTNQCELEVQRTIHLQSIAN